MSFCGASACLQMQQLWSACDMHDVMLTRMVTSLMCATGQSTMAAPRLLCVLGADAEAEVIEEFVSPATDYSISHVTNALAEIELAQGASLQHG